MKRIMKAAKFYLERSDREVIDNHDDVLFIKDDEGLAIVQVFVDEVKPMSRSRFKKEAVDFLGKHDDCVNMQVRYDTLVFYIINNDRALLEYHVMANFDWEE